MLEQSPQKRSEQLQPTVQIAYNGSASRRACPTVASAQAFRHHRTYRMPTCCLSANAAFGLLHDLAPARSPTQTLRPPKQPSVPSPFNAMTVQLVTCRSPSHRSTTKY